MRPITIVAAGAVTTAPVPMDMYQDPFNVGLGLVKTSGTIDATVQHTFDDVFAAGYTPAGGTWFNHPTLAAATASADGNYAFPVTAIRLVNAGTGTVTLTIVQAGMPGR